MSVRLRVVGIFFDQVLPTFGTGPFSLDLVLQGARILAYQGGLPNISAFNYRTDQNGDAVLFLADYKSAFGPTKGGKTYPAGLYSLSQNLSTTPSYTVWQYYVADASGVPISYGRTPFSDPSVVVPDGGSVVWRLVSILNGPTGLNAREERGLETSFDGAKSTVVLTKSP